MKILTIVGARPQIIKAAGLSRAIAGKFSGLIEEVIVHTGQHYDSNMSEVFFVELGIPEAKYNLEVGSGQHGEQTAKMIIGIEELLNSEKPDAIVLYGDTNSTLAGAIAASKIHIPVVHIEAGLRSFNKSMPEEINRITCDHASTLLFSPTKAGVENLGNEGFEIGRSKDVSIDAPGVFHCGDIMYDNSLHFGELSENASIKEFCSRFASFSLVTVHRNDNTDRPERLRAILEALIEIADEGNDLIFPIHPRTSKMLSSVGEDLVNDFKSNSRIHLIDPVSFLDMTYLEKNAHVVITDSGGVQKEAYFFEKGCVILRPETEWVEIVETGAATLASSDKDEIIEGFKKMSVLSMEFPPIFGDGRAAEFMCQKIIDVLA